MIISEFTSNLFIYLLFRVTTLHQRWLSLRTSFQSRVVQRLGGISVPVQQTTVRRETRTVLETRVADTNAHFTHLMECSEWCRERLVSDIYIYILLFLYPFMKCY